MEEGQFDPRISPKGRNNMETDKTPVRQKVKRLEVLLRKKSDSIEKRKLSTRSGGRQISIEKFLMGLRGRRNKERYDQECRLRTKP